MKYKKIVIEFKINEILKNEIIFRLKKSIFSNMDNNKNNLGELMN